MRGWWVHLDYSVREAFKNKLKSLKVAQVKDEMDDDEADGCDSVCGVVS